MPIDPIQFCNLCWPDMMLYSKQREILYSVRDNEETYVPAGNMLGKDFVAGLAALWFFVAYHPVRVLTTSVKDEHLDVLWGEMDRFLRTSKTALLHNDGGMLLYNHHEIRKIINGSLDKYSYLKGQVSKRGEGLSGHHAEHTLLIVDEASGVENMVYDMGIAWADRMLVIGNPNPCANFFYNGVKGGDVPSPTNEHMFRKVIHIRAEDSPNVRLAEKERKEGKEPSGRTVIPGVLKYGQYVTRRAMWDNVRQCIGLDGQFYEGAEVLLFPPEWLNRAEHVADKLPVKRKAEAIGVDSAEGGDNTAWAIVDHNGLIDLISMKTPDTSIITGRTLALMREYNVRPEQVLFDAGGGGKEHADRLRSQRYNVRTIAFGGSPTLPRKRGLRPMEQRVEEDETKQAYKNRRAEMYGVLRAKLDPIHKQGFGIPARFTELRQQLSVIPYQFDDRGRLELPPKGSHAKTVNKTTSKATLTELIGHSPDEADALVLGVFGIFYKTTKSVAKAIL